MEYQNIKQIEELICNSSFWEAFFLTPEQVFFRKLWLAEQEERLKKLRSARRKLTKAQNKLVHQVYFNKMPFKEIAEEENCDLSGVYKRHRIILDFLRSQF